MQTTAIMASTLLSYFARILVVLFVYVVYTQVLDAVRWRNLRQWGQKHGCGYAVAKKNRLPGGLEDYFLPFTKGFKGK